MALMTGWVYLKKDLPIFSERFSEWMMDDESVHLQHFIFFIAVMAVKYFEKYSQQI